MANFCDNRICIVSTERGVGETIYKMLKNLEAAECIQPLGDLDATAPVRDNLLDQRAAKAVYYGGKLNRQISAHGFSRAVQLAQHRPFRQEHSLLQVRPCAVSHAACSAGMRLRHA